MGQCLLNGNEEKWLQVNKNGFLDYYATLNGSTMFEFVGKLFAYNATGLFKLISAKNKVWQQMYIPIGLSKNKNYMSVTPIGNHLYLKNQNEVFKLEKSYIDNSELWYSLSNYSVDIGQSIDVQPMCIFNSEIYGVANIGSGLYIVKSRDIESMSYMKWRIVTPNLRENSDNIAISFMTVYDGYIYVGTNCILQGEINDDSVYSKKGVQIWRSKNGELNTWAQINNSGFGSVVYVNGQTKYVNQIIGSYKLLKDSSNNKEYLYVGTNSKFGSELWRFNSKENLWEKIELKKFGNEVTTTIPSMDSFKGKLAIIQNGDDLGRVVYYYGDKYFDYDYCPCKNNNCISVKQSGKVSNCNDKDSNNSCCDKEEDIKLMGRYVKNYEGGLYLSTYGGANYLGDRVWVFYDKKCANEILNEAVHSGKNSTSEGCSTVALGNCSHAEGINTVAKGRASHAEGASTQAIGCYSHAEGNGTKSNGPLAHTEGFLSEADGHASHAEGYCTRANNLAAHTEGYYTEADGYVSHAEGYYSKSSGPYSHVEGAYSEASGYMSHAEGYNTKSNGYTSHAEGRYSQASGYTTHAEGYATKAINDYSHTEGYFTEAKGVVSHAEGIISSARGFSSHVEGIYSQSNGYASHAEGVETIADAYASHATGIRTNANVEGQTVIGRYNVETNRNLPQNEYDLFIIGNGQWYKKSNALRVNAKGDVFNSGTNYGTGFDYAEMFQWKDGNLEEEDRIGYFVTLDGNTIRKATFKDTYILGVTSANSLIVGDAQGNAWKDKYLKDEWGRIQYEAIEVERKIYLCEDNKLIEKTEMVTEYLPKINPLYSEEKEYLSRSLRKEWASVGIMGKVLVRDDGSCRVNGYCRPNNKGIATTSVKGYRVLARTAENQILILIK